MIVQAEKVPLRVCFSTETNAKGDDFFLGIKEEGKPLLPAVSSALVLGAVLGFGEACVLASLAGPVLTVMGVNPVSLIITYIILCVRTACIT